MKVIRSEQSDQWAVADDGGNVLVDGLQTNAEGWRWIDRHEGDPLSPAQKRSDFWWQNHIDDA